MRRDEQGARDLDFALKHATRADLEQYVRTRPEVYRDAGRVAFDLMGVTWQRVEERLQALYDEQAAEPFPRKAIEVGPWLVGDEARRKKIRAAEAERRLVFDRMCPPSAGGQKEDTRPAQTTSPAEAGAATGRNQ